MVHKETILGVICGATSYRSPLIHSPLLLVQATSERRVRTLVATNVSHWLT
jgi:hypothetical protein